MARPRNYKYHRGVASRFTQNLLVRLFIFGRDGNKCVQCCSTENLTVDHITSIYRNGTNTFDNLQTLCNRCNARKAP